MHSRTCYDSLRRFGRSGDRHYGDWRTAGSGVQAKRDSDSSQGTERPGQEGASARKEARSRPLRSREGGLRGFNRPLIGRIR